MRGTVPDPFARDFGPNLSIVQIYLHTLSTCAHWAALHDTVVRGGEINMDIPMEQGLVAIHPIRQGVAPDQARLWLGMLQAQVAGYARRLGYF